MSSPESTGRRLFPYERKLVAWQLQRWRAGSRFDVDKSERDHGPESVRLHAAYSGGFLLARIIGLIAVAASVICGIVFGDIGFLVALGIPFLMLIAVGLIAITRQTQSENARQEYHQNGQFTHQ